MPSGYSGTPLTKKLGIKEGFKILPVNAPDYYFDLLEDLPEDLVVLEQKNKEKADFIHLFAKESKFLLQEFPRLKEHLEINGMIWVSWQKKASKVPTDVDENLVRSTGLKNGLVDIKICAVDEIWSGLKFVYRVKDR